jgi:hypothetical protein
VEPETEEDDAVVRSIPRLVAVVDPVALAIEMLPPTLLVMTNLPSCTRAVTFTSDALLIASRTSLTVAARLRIDGRGLGVGRVL